MRDIAEYDGALLNHMQGFYPPGNRDLTVELLEALGLVCVDVPISETISVVRAHFNSRDPNTVDNVMFLSEMAPSQVKLDRLLQDRMSSDREFGEAVGEYLAYAHVGDYTPHFGVRYPTGDGFEQALGKLQALSPQLSERVRVSEIPPYDPVEGFPSIRQVFLRTDVFAVGLTTLGQTIELQVERGK